MKYLKHFEIADQDTLLGDIDYREPKNLLCVSLSTDFNIKFTIGKLYPVENYFDKYLLFRDDNANGYIANKKDKHTWQIFTSENDIIIGTFTDDKSIYAYKKRLVTQQFDL